MEKDNQTTKNFDSSDGVKNVLEAVLFVAGKPLRVKELAKILEIPEAKILSSLTMIAEEKKHAGIILMGNNGEFQLTTNSAYSTQVKNFLNAELREKLTDATVEVLAIIAYRQPISKAEIEAIRGVNSQYSLRNLLMRGLIEKVANPSDARSFLYQTTTEFLMHLGIPSVSDLPDFEKLVENIKLPQTPALISEDGASVSKDALAETGLPEQTEEIKIEISPAVEATSTEAAPVEQAVIQEITETSKIEPEKIEKTTTETNKDEPEEDEGDDEDEE